MQLLRSATLSSGPESGFANQIFALIGYCVIAKQRGIGLLLPNFTTHDHGGIDIAFRELFEVEPFVRSLASVNITAVDTVVTSSKVRFWRPTPWHGGSLAGWRIYKQGCSTPGCKSRPRGSDRDAIESAVLAGLRPSPRLRRRVDRMQRELRWPIHEDSTHSGTEHHPVSEEASGLEGRTNGLQGYGCLHARIEQDMIKSWRMNRAGHPPLLASYMDGIAASPVLRNTRSIFVAVGLAISNADNRTLMRPTSWGATLFRTTGGKAWHRWRPSHNETAASYTEASIVDFTICREAQWLVGWPGSTFARTLATLQWLDHKRGWYRACPSRPLQYIEGLYLDHGGCIVANKK